MDEASCAFETLYGMWETIGLPVAAVSDTVVVGVVAMAGTVAAAWLGNRASRRQAEANHEEGARGRFANWQLRKRDIYAEFLAQARAYREDPSSDEARLAFLSQSDRVMLAANKELRKSMREQLEDGKPPRDGEAWRALVEALARDARQPKVND